MAVEGAHKAKEAASALTDDTDSRHVIHFRFFPRYSRLRASMHRMHTTSDRDNATFAPLNLFPLASSKEVRGMDRDRQTGLIRLLRQRQSIFSVYSYLSGNKRNILGGTD